MDDDNYHDNREIWFRTSEYDSQTSLISYNIQTQERLASESQLMQDLKTQEEETK